VHYIPKPARVVELVDAGDSKSPDLRVLRVRVAPRALPGNFGGSLSFQTRFVVIRSLGDGRLNEHGRLIASTESKAWLQTNADAAQTDADRHRQQLSDDESRMLASGRLGSSA
jgi:hypothetical protein